jgi:hypothetical protein
MHGALVPAVARRGMRREGTGQTGLPSAACASIDPLRQQCRYHIMIGLMGTYMHNL